MSPRSSKLDELRGCSQVRLEFGVWLAPKFDLRWLGLLHLLSQVVPMIQGHQTGDCPAGGAKL